MKSIFTTFFIFSFWSTAYGATGSAIELKEVVRSALKSAPALEAIRASAKKSEGKAFANVGVFDPTLTAEYKNKDGYYQREFQSLGVEQLTPFWGAKLIAGFRKSNGLLPIYELGDQTLNRGEWSGGVSVPLLKGGLTDEYRTKLAASRKEAESANYSVKNSELEIARVTSSLYWDWVFSGHRYLINQSLYQLALDRDRQIQLRVQHGDLPAIERDENRRSILQREAIVLSAKRSFQKAALDLSMFYRGTQGEATLASDAALPQEVSLPELPIELPSSAEETSSKVLSNHPNWSSLQALEEKSQLELRWARVQHLPELNMKLMTSQDRGDGGSSLKTREVVFGLQLEVPLLFRSARGEIASASAEISRIDSTKQLFQDQLQIRIADSIQSIQNNRDRVEILRQEVETTAKVETAERIRFLHGDSSLLMVNMREQMTADARIKEIQAKTEYWKSWIDNQLNQAIRFWE